MRSVSRAVSVLALAVALAAASSARADHDEYTCPDHPANDDHANATAIPFVPFAAVGTTGCATPEPGEPEAWCDDAVWQKPWGESSVWYRYHPAETSRITANVFGVSNAGLLPLAFLLNTTYPFPSVIHVYEGDSFGALEYSCGVSNGPLQISQASFLAVEGKTYFIQVIPVIEGPRGEGVGDFVFVLAPRVETDPAEVLP